MEAFDLSPAALARIERNLNRRPRIPPTPEECYALLAAARRNAELQNAIDALRDWFTFRDQRVEPLDDEHRQAIADHEAELRSTLDAALSKLEPPR